MDNDVEEKEEQANGDQIFRKKFEFKHFISTITI